MMTLRRCCLLLLTLCCLFLLTSCTREQQEQEQQQIVDLNSFQKPDDSKRNYLAFDDTRTNIGIYLNETAEMEALERMPQVVGWFEEWYREGSRAKIDLLGADHLAIPFITWEPTDISLESIAAGEHDEYITHYLTLLAIVCPDNDILIRFGHEMEMRPKYQANWYSWQAEDGEAYRKAWIHLVEVGRKVNENVKWVWSPNRADQYSEPYYPGGDYVDYVGITMNLPLERAKAYADFRSFYEKEGIRSNLEQYGKPIIISEVAYPSNDVEAKVRYLQSVMDCAAADPRICGVNFFNEDKGDNKLYRVMDEEAFMRVIYEGIEQYEHTEPKTAE